MSLPFASIDVLKNVSIDSEFESVCPSLSDDELELLEQNILSDGEVFNALIVWNNTLIDGHHRRQIILKHPEIPFHIKKVTFTDRYEAIVWICKKQAGRRNLTPKQLTYLMGKRYEAEKHTMGASDGFRGNQYTVHGGQNEHLPNFVKTDERIAKAYGVGHATIRRAEQYAKGVDAAEAACPGTKQELLFGSFKPTNKEVEALSKLPLDEVADKLSEYQKAQEDRKEERRRAREEKRRRLDKAKKGNKSICSLADIKELSEEMAKPKPRNNVSNVINIIEGMASSVQASIESYISEFPELLGADRPRLVEALSGLMDYLNSIRNI